MAALFTGTGLQHSRHLDNNTDKTATKIGGVKCLCIASLLYLPYSQAKPKKLMMVGRVDRRRLRPHHVSHTKIITTRLDDTLHYIIYSIIYTYHTDGYIYIVRNNIF